MSMGPHPVVENHHRCLSAESARLLLAIALLQVTGDVLLQWHTAGDLDACASDRAPHDWSIMLPVSQRVQPGVYTLMALSRYRDALGRWELAFLHLSSNPCGVLHCSLPLRPSSLQFGLRILISSRSTEGLISAAHTPPRHASHLCQALCGHWN